MGSLARRSELEKDEKNEANNVDHTNVLTTKTKHCLSMSSASSLLSTSTMIESLLEGSVPAKLIPDKVDSVYLYDRRSVCVLPRAMPNVVHDPPSEASHSHIVDRVVHPSAFSQRSATTAHNSFKKGFLLNRIENL